MNWDAVSAVGQVIGAIAVVATLIFLALQIRQNTRAVRGASEFDAMNQYVTVNDYLLQNPELLNFMVRAQDPLLRPTDLSPDDQVRYGVFCRTIFPRLQAHFHLYRNGLIDEEGWNNWRSWGRGFIEPPIPAHWWKGERTQPLYARAFIEEIEKAVVVPLNQGGFDRFGESRKAE